MNTRTDAGCVFAILLLACAMVVAFAVRECEREQESQEETSSSESGS